jgi:hypothetical protein
VHAERHLYPTGTPQPVHRDTADPDWIAE